MKVIMVCTKKVLFRTNGLFEPKNGTSSYLWIGSKNFLKFGRMKGAHRYMEILLVAFQETIHLGQSDPFSLFLLFDWAGSNRARLLIKWDTHLPKTVSFASRKAFLISYDEKWIFFHLKNSFSSQDIQLFVLTFCLCRKKCLIRKIRLISKFMTSHPG